MNSANKCDDYIKNTIVPAFQAMVNQDIISTIYDYDDNIILTTQKLAHIFGYDSWQDVSNVPAKDILYRRTLPADVSSQFEQNIRTMFELRFKLAAVRKAVVNLKRPISTLLVHPFNKVFDSFLLTTFIPLFMPNGDVVAVLGTTTNYSMFGIQEFRDSLEKIHQTKHKKNTIPAQLPKALTTRQHEILFLLLLGATQEMVAQILEISRGSITKTITQSILPKFDLCGASVKLLVEYCRQKNFHYIIPRSLCIPRLIILDNDANSYLKTGSKKSTE